MLASIFILSSAEASSVGWSQCIRDGPHQLEFYVGLKQGSPVNVERHLNQQKEKVVFNHAFESHSLNQKDQNMIVKYQWSLHFILKMKQIKEKMIINHRQQNKLKNISDHFDHVLNEVTICLNILWCFRVNLIYFLLFFGLDADIPD